MSYRGADRCDSIFGADGKEGVRTGNVDEGDVPIEEDWAGNLAQGSVSVAIDIDLARIECGDSGGELIRNIRRDISIGRMRWFS